MLKNLLFLGVISLILLSVVNAADSVCPSEGKGGDACYPVKSMVAPQEGVSILSEGTTKKYRGYTGTGGSCEWPPYVHEVTLDITDINVSAINSATLTVEAYDCDNPDLSGGCSGGPEIDTVYFNGDNVGVLTGATDQWSTVSFTIDQTKIVNGSNYVKVFIDTTGTGCWCLGVDWVELAVDINDIDLKVNSSDIVLFKDSENRYHAEATIHNEGSIDAENVEAKVLVTYLGSVMGEEVYSVGTIAAKSSQKIRHDFIAIDLGNYQIQVIADPDGKVDETNENNNIGKTHKVSGVVKDNGGTALENLAVVLEQKDSPGANYSEKYRTFTDEGGNYAIITNFNNILEGKDTQVKSTVEYSPDRDQNKLKLQVYDDSEWGSNFNPKANAKPYSKEEALGNMDKERDYSKDITYANHNTLVALKTLVKGYKYAKDNNIPVKQNIKIEVNNVDACECGARCPETSCALAPIMTMWHTRSDKVDSMNHEYGHIASNENGVNNKYEPVEENWANYFSCKSRGTSLYNFWGDIIDISNDDDTDGDNHITGAGGGGEKNFTYVDAANVTQPSNIWNFQLAGVYWDLTEASVIAALKRSGQNTPEDFYNAYKTTVGAANASAKAIKRIFRNHGINALNWDPAGYNVSRRGITSDANEIQPLGYLTNSYSHTPVDSNGDGSYEALNIQIGVNITQNGIHYMLGFLTSGGSESCFASSLSNLTTGLRNMTLSFPGTCIFSKNLDGVYRLENVVLENANFTELESANQPYNTSSYTHTQFGAPLVFFNGTHSDMGLNTDADPAYEFLQVSVIMNLSLTGSYILHGVLLDSDGSAIFSHDNYANGTSASLPATPSIANITLNFSGAQIYASQKNGPYKVELYVYNDSTYEFLVYSYSLGFNTSAYNYTAFEGSSTLLASVSGSAVDSNNNSFYDYIRVNVTVNVSRNDTYIVDAYLSDSEETPITSASNMTTLSSGVSQLLVYLDGREIRKKSKDGPYNITCVLYNSNQEMVSTLKSVTSAYGYASFEVYGENYFNINYSDYGKDSDSNGKYNYLTVDMNVSTNLDASYATYIFVVSLYDKNGGFVTQSTVNASLNNQPKLVQLNLSGQDIWSKKVMNGTYNLTLYVYKYEENDTLVASLENAYTTSAYNYSQFEANPSEFNGVYSDAGLDSDSDGLYNSLKISVGVNVSENGTYTITGYLYDGNGAYITSANNATSLTAGVKSVYLYFDGLEIFNHGFNGTYMLKNLVLQKEGEQVDYEENAYTTSSYNHTKFQQPPVTIRGYSDYGVDTNNNSKYDQLVIDVGINVLNTGTYAINARLVDNLSREIVWASNSSYLYKNQTNQTMQVRFSGKSIYGTLINGPYYLRNLYVYNTGTTTQSISVDRAYTTNAYNFTQFEASGVVDGFVLNASGATVANSIVSYLGGDSDVTNASGYYRLIISSTNSYTITAAPPYGTYYVSNSTTVNASVGNTTQANITLPSQAVLIVNVFAQNGSPVNYSSVSLSGATSKSNYTNGNGSCSLDKLKGGAYTLTVTPPEGPNLITNTTTLNLSYGEMRTINITLLEGGIITGIITRIDGSPVYNAYVYIYSGPSSGSDYSDQNGTYYMQRLKNGTYNVSVSPPYGSNLKSNSTLVSVTNGETKIADLMLASLPEIYVNNNTTLNGSVYDMDDSDEDGAIIINASNVLLDCNGSTIRGMGLGYGIYIPSGKNNVTIKNCILQNYEMGVYVYYSLNSAIINNTIKDVSDYGIYLYSSNNNTITSNNISNCTSYYYGVYGYYSSYLTIALNNIHNCYYGVYLSSANANNIASNNIYNNSYYGLYLSSMTNNNITANSMQSNRYNLWIYGYSLSHFNNSIDETNTIGGQPVYYYFNQNGGTVENKNAGQITLAYSSSMTIRNNNITSGDGIILYNSNLSSIQNNIVFMSTYGAYLDSYSLNNTLSNNIFCSNRGYDIYAGGSSCGTGTGNSCDAVSWYWHDNNKSSGYCTSTCSAQYTTTTTSTMPATTTTTQPATTTTTSTTSTTSTSTTSTSTTTTSLFSVVINEFMASPVGADDASKPNGEWVELYNNGTFQKDLSGWYLTEDGGSLNITSNRTNTGNTLIAPRAFLVVYRDGAQYFDLGDAYDNISLWTQLNLMMDTVSYNATQLNASWSVLPENSSVGRSVDGSGVWRSFNQSTPSGSNLGSVSTQAVLPLGWNLISIPLNLQ